MRKTRLSAYLSALISSVAISLSFSVAANNSFNSQVNLSYGEVEETDNLGITGTYFFDAVSTAKGPLREAVFLDPTSSITLGYSTTDTDFGPGLLSADADNWRVGGRYVTADQRFFGSLGVTRMDSTLIQDIPEFGVLRTDRDLEAYDVGVGMYLTRDWTVSGSVAFIDDSSFDLSSIGLSTKRLFDLGSERYVSVFGAVSFNDDFEDSYNIGAEYYFNRNFSLAASHNWQRNLGDIDDGALNISANWFVTPNIALTAGTAFATSRSNPDNFSIGIEGRF